MSDLTVTPRLVARAYDANRNGKVSDDLSIDREALPALGGDANVTVEELASALGNDRVLISSGRVELARGPMRVPALHGEYARIHEVAADALNQTINWWVPTRPNRDFYSNEQDYREAVNRYRRERQEYKEKIRIDSAIMANALRNIASVSDDPEIRRIARDTLESQFLRDLGGLIWDDNTINRYETDRAILRNALSTIATLSDVPNVPAVLSRANQALQAAQADVQTEDQVLRNERDAALKRAEEKAATKRDSWFFGKTRAKMVDKKAAEVRAYATEPKTNTLTELARRAYETGINALHGYSKEGARSLGAELDKVTQQAQSIGSTSRNEVNEVRKLGK